MPLGCADPGQLPIVHATIAVVSQPTPTREPRRGSHAAPDRARWGRRILVGLATLVLLVGGGTLVALTVLQSNIRTADLARCSGPTGPPWPR